jgi:hypothetical protein
MTDYQAKYFHSCPCCFCLCDCLQIVLYDDVFEPPRMLQEAGNLVLGMHMPEKMHLLINLRKRVEDQCGRT